jgi:hypothetical protein
MAMDLVSLRAGDCKVKALPNVRLTLAERAQVEAAAQALGLSLSEVVRRSLRVYVAVRAAEASCEQRTGT